MSCKPRDTCDANSNIGEEILQAIEDVKAGRIGAQYRVRQPSNNEALRVEVMAGHASGPGKPADEVFDRLEAKYDAMTRTY